MLCDTMCPKQKVCALKKTCVRDLKSIQPSESCNWQSEYICRNEHTASLVMTLTKKKS